MKSMDGLTIVELMVMLLIVGVVATFAVNYIIDKRCEDEPSRQLCRDRAAAK